MALDSDDDFMGESGDEEQFDFEYEDDEDEQDAPDAKIENTYYQAKQTKTTDPRTAIAEFLSIPPLEDEKGEWGFKGLKQAIKLELSLKQYDSALAHYQELLTYIKSAVNRNYGEKSITNMLGFLEKVSDDPAARKCMETFYSQTLESFTNTRNDRLWLKINLKFARLYLDAKQYAPLTLKLRELYDACQSEPGTDPDSAKGTYLLETYALEIQMYAEQNNIKRLKALYERAIKVKSAVPHPKIMGIIRECGGKMHMREENWDQAQQAFFESFRNYDEAGSMQRITVLKYLVLTTMLMRSDINPFDSQETKPYQTDHRIAGMTALVAAYQRGDVGSYMTILYQHRPEIFGDPFIAEYIQEVTRSMRMRALLKLVAPYTTFTVSFCARSLTVDEPEALELLSYLIVTDQLRAKIDQEAGAVHRTSSTDAERVDALNRWSRALERIVGSAMSGSDGIEARAASSKRGNQSFNASFGIGGMRLGVGGGGYVFEMLQRSPQWDDLRSAANAAVDDGATILGLDDALISPPVAVEGGQGSSQNVGAARRRAGAAARRLESLSQEDEIGGVPVIALDGVEEGFGGGNGGAAC